MTALTLQHGGLGRASCRRQNPAGHLCSCPRAEGAVHVATARVTIERPASRSWRNCAGLVTGDYCNMLMIMQPARLYKCHLATGIHHLRDDFVYCIV